MLQSPCTAAKKITLHINATETVSHKACARQTYNKNKGFMSMAGHITETGQIVAVDFRHGNVPPAQDNLAFIKTRKRDLQALESLAAPYLGIWK